MAQSVPQAQKILENMVAFINQHGDEEVARIKESEAQEFTIRSMKYFEEQKQIIDDNFKADLQNQEIRLKIEQSKKQNEMRIARMRKVNEYIEDLKAQTKAQLRDQIKKDKAVYKKLLEDLLVQGLIKMMEPQIFIRCRASDVAVFQEIQPAAVKKYRELMVGQVKRFEGMAPTDIPCNIVIDKTHLESVEDNEANGVIGGFKIFAKKGKIVLSQTIDDRIDLCFQAAIPAIRHMLFPSMRNAKESKDKKE